MMWSDRSASPARRWWDRVARRPAPRGSKIPEDDRSFVVSCFVLFEIAQATMLMAAAFAVKAARGVRCCRERKCFALPHSQNTRLAFALGEVGLAFSGAIGRAGFAAADARPVPRKPHPLRPHRRALRTERS